MSNKVIAPRFLLLGVVEENVVEWLDKECINYQMLLGVVEENLVEWLDKECINYLMLLGVVEENVVEWLDKECINYQMLLGLLFLSSLSSIYPTAVSTKSVAAFIVCPLSVAFAVLSVLLLLVSVECMFIEMFV